MFITAACALYFLLKYKHALSGFVLPFATKLKALVISPNQRNHNFPAVLPMGTLVSVILVGVVLTTPTTQH